MSKRQLIDDIRRFNSTAHPKFLSQFDESALKQYLEHLEGARDKHLRYSGIAAAHRAARVRMAS
jgi:hypothetical protein